MLDEVPTTRLTHLTRDGAPRRHSASLLDSPLSRPPVPPSSSASLSPRNTLGRPRPSARHSRPRAPPRRWLRRQPPRRPRRHPTSSDLGAGSSSSRRRPPRRQPRRPPRHLLPRRLDRLRRQAAHGDERIPLGTDPMPSPPSDPSELWERPPRSSSRLQHTRTRRNVILRAEVEAVDLACSRFRPDSELASFHANAGRTVEVSPLLFEALDVAYRVAERTHGAVDPTVGSAIVALGYDRHFEEIESRPLRLADLGPVPGFRHLHLDHARRTARIPEGRSP